MAEAGCFSSTIFPANFLNFLHNLVAFFLQQLDVSFFILNYFFQVLYPDSEILIFSQNGDVLLLQREQLISQLIGLLITSIGNNGCLLGLNRRIEIDCFEFGFVGLLYIELLFFENLNHIFVFLQLYLHMHYLFIFC